MSAPNADDSKFEAANVLGGTGEDPHEALDAREALADATVVVPTNRERNITTESLPEWVDVVVATDRGLNVARNRGVEAADGEWIVLVDDDVTFPTRLTAALVDSMHEGHLVGLEDFWPMRYVIGRYMVFHRSLWREVGGFDESRPHGGDTDFAIRCEKAGGRVLRLPRRLVPHHDSTSEFSTAAHAEWLFYLFRRHPRHVAVPAAKLALKNLGLLTPREAEYPEGWASQVWVPPSSLDGEP
ncbi:MAG: glycosyltransferase family 2 protein [Salinigranum sp.]